MKHNERKIKLTKQKASPPASNELAMEIQIRKRYADTWPNTILQLTKRVQAVNQTWAGIMFKLVTVPGLRISYAKEGDELVVMVSNGKKTERHPITAEELYAAQQYVEVLVMEKISHSELLQ